MLIAKLFLPLSTPGLAALGLGILGVTNGTYDAAEVIAIIVGLFVVAIAGIFTIRSNVAKIWREQAEGEKARNEDLTAQIATLRLEWAAEVAKLTKEHAQTVAQEQVTLDALAAANQRTDMTPVLAILHEILAAVASPAHIEMTGPAGAPLKVETVERTRDAHRS